MTSIYLIEWSRLNGKIWKKKGTKNDQKRLLTRLPLNKSPKLEPKHQNSSILRVVQTPRRQARGGCAPALAVCLRSPIKAKNNRRHVQQAVSKKNRRYSFSNSLDGFATAEHGMKQSIQFYFLTSLTSPSLGMKGRKSLLLVKIR